MQCSKNLRLPYGSKHWDIPCLGPQKCSHTVGGGEFKQVPPLTVTHKTAPITLTNKSRSHKSHCTGHWLYYAIPNQLLWDTLSPPICFLACILTGGGRSGGWSSHGWPGKKFVPQQTYLKMISTLFVGTNC